MLVGVELSETVLADLATRWINRNWAEAAELRVVDHFTGKELVNGRRGDYSGVSIPYFFPGTTQIVSYRLRRFNPEVDLRTGKPRGKYITAQADRNHIYFPRSTRPDELTNVSLPLFIVEGELKAIAARRLACEGVGMVRFVPIGLSGIWGWKGTVGAANNENGVRVPVKGVIPDLDLITWLKRYVIIAFDRDNPPKREVLMARHALSVELRSRGANVGFLEWNPELGKGPDDWLAKVGPDAVLAAIAQVEFNTASGWEARLLCHDTGKPRKVAENARIVLEHVPEFAGLALDEFSGRIVRPPSAPWPAATNDWGDVDSLELAMWLQRKSIDLGKEAAHDAVQTMATRNRFHPVRNYLESLQWDGEPRIDQWLTRYVGVAYDNYTAAAGRCWLISAVARIMQPGCKADVALLLIGGEGVYKSTVCRILGEPWFSDNIPDLGNKLVDAQMHMRGHWILELGELAALGKAELTTIKSWMSRAEDVYRPSYGRIIVHQPRQCVFIATSNEGEPLKDTTGNRRFWPVEVGTIDIQALAADKDQLWAEALELYRAGALWWFTDESIIEAARREQTARLDLPVWHDPINRWCVDRELVTITDILEQGLHKEKARQTQADKINVVRCLQVMGWKPTRRRIDGKVSRVYLNPEMLG
jgi:predicted P-loop ATPase